MGSGGRIPDRLPEASLQAHRRREAPEGAEGYAPKDGAGLASEGKSPRVSLSAKLTVRPSGVAAVTGVAESPVTAGASFTLEGPLRYLWKSFTTRGGAAENPESLRALQSHSVCPHFV